MLEELEDGRTGRMPESPDVQIHPNVRRTMFYI
jgi:hypothetical protein